MLIRIPRREGAQGQGEKGRTPGSPAECRRGARGKDGRGGALLVEGREGRREERMEGGKEGAGRDLERNTTSKDTCGWSLSLPDCGGAVFRSWG